jgi:glycosyltransferase involved in cell wall biosynthesis
LPEWERLAPAFRALVGRAPNVRFKVICSRAPCALDLPVSFERWSQKREAAHLEDVDVGIMPLADTPWNRGKCAFKALQYMATGLPVVASGVGMNTEVVEDGRSGYLVGDEADWIDALARLAANGEMRRRMGREGRASVELRYACSVIGPRVADLIESVGSSAGAR